jgi:hypothetical protein
MNELKFAGMTLTAEFVSPAIAKRWLELNTVNRRVRRAFVSMYARAQKEGRWYPKPLAICFDEQGKLGNGQHTLLAIIESGITQELLIARNVPTASIAVLDTGLRRSVNDIAHFVGSDLRSREAAICRGLVFGIGDTEARSFNELFDIYAEYQDKIDFICAMCPREAGFGTSLLVVMVRALFHAPADRIERAIEILRDGLTEGPHEQAIIRLRDHARSHGKQGGRQARIELYRRAENAMAAFLKGQSLTKLYGTEKELFPLPSENLRKAA